MTRVRIEQFDAEVHRNHMPEVGQTIDPRGQVIVVEHGRYRLEFLSLEQLAVATRFFGDKTGGSTRLGPINGSHWEFQPWSSRLPAGINNKHNRQGIQEALAQAAIKCEEAGYRAACT